MQENEPLPEEFWDELDEDEAPGDDFDDWPGWTDRDLVLILFDQYVIREAVIRDAIPALKRSLRQRSIEAENRDL